MAAENSGKDGEFFDDINFDDVGGLEDAQAESGVLPKKVELDIDDMYLEEDEGEEEAAPAAREEAPAEKPPPPAEAPAEKAPRKKRPLLAIVLAVVLPFVLVIVPVGYYILREAPSPEQPPPQVELGPGQVQLDPFLINFPSREKEALVRLSLLIGFQSPQDPGSLDEKTVIMRDLIYRYVQSLDPAGLDSDEARARLAADLVAVLNSTPESGGVEEVVVLELEAV
jgi:flagellar basal body-associated protein FliL